MVLRTGCLLVPLSILQLHALRFGESTDLQVYFEGDCTQPCAAKDPQNDCVCRCSEALPYLSFDEARVLIRADAAIKGDFDSENVTDWDSVCNRIDSDESLHQDFLVVFRLQAMKAAADLVHIYRKDLVKVDATSKLGLGLGGVLASAVSYLQFAADKKIVLDDLRNCAMKFLAKSDGSVFGWEVAEDAAETYLGSTCKGIRLRIFSVLGGLIATIGSAFFNTVFRTLEKFSEAVSAVVIDKQNPVSVIIMFIDALGVGGPWLHTVLNAMLYLSPKAGEILRGRKQVEPYFKESAAREAVINFVLRLAELSTMQHQLQLARERSSAVAQCVSEHGSCAGQVGGALVDCESHLATATEECRKLLDSSLSVRGFCGVTLGRGDSESVCAAYAVQAVPPPGAFVETLGWDAFRHGLRACDVIQEIEFREGGSFGFLPQWAQRRMGVEEKTRTIAVEGPETIQKLLQEDRAAMVSDDLLGRQYEVSWTATLVGKSLVLSKLPEVEWEDVTLVEDFMFGLLECSPYQKSLIAAGAHNATS